MNNKMLNDIQMRLWKNQNKTFKIIFALFIIFTFVNAICSYKYKQFEIFITFNATFFSLIVLRGWIKNPLKKDFLIKFISFLVLMISLLGFILKDLECINESKSFLIIINTIEFLLMVLSVNFDKCSTSEEKYRSDIIRVEIIQRNTIKEHKQIYTYKLIEHIKMVDNRIKWYNSIQDKTKKFCIGLISAYCILDLSNDNKNQYIIFLSIIGTTWLYDAYCLYLIKLYQKLRDEISNGLYYTYVLKHETKILESCKYIFDISLFSYYGLLALVMIYKALRIDVIEEIIKITKIQ